MTGHYTYRLSWSPEDGGYVATCAEFPSLSWLEADEVSALRGMKDMVQSAVEDMLANGEPPCIPLG